MKCIRFYSTRSRCCFRFIFQTLPNPHFHTVAHQPVTFQTKSSHFSHVIAVPASRAHSENASLPVYSEAEVAALARYGPRQKVLVKIKAVVCNIKYEHVFPRVDGNGFHLYFYKDFFLLLVVEHLFKTLNFQFFQFHTVFESYVLFSQFSILQNSQ